jgi:CysZ protein
MSQVTPGHASRDADVMAGGVRLERRGALRDLVSGVRAVTSALAFVVTSEGGLRTALAPAAIAFGVWVLLTGVAAGAIVGVLHGMAPARGEYGAIGRALVATLVFLVASVVTGLVAFAVAQPLSRSALDRLASRLARSLGRQEPNGPSSSLLGALRTVLGALGFVVPSVGLVQLVTAMAPEAALFTEPFAFVFAALALAWELLDHPMSRRGMPWRERLRWIRQNLALVVGFALATQALLLVPVLDLFALPIGVLGATKLLYLTSSSSTSNTSVEPGGMTGGNPRSP